MVMLMGMSLALLSIDCRSEERSCLGTAQVSKSRGYVSRERAYQSMFQVKIPRHILLKRSLWISRDPAFASLTTSPNITSTIPHSTHLTPWPTYQTASSHTV